MRHKQRSDSEFDPRGGVERFTIGCLAVPFGLLATWMWWIVAKFAAGGGWFDLIVKLVVDELILAVGLLALLLLIWAVFAPPWILRIVDGARKNVVKAIMLFFVLLIAPGLLFVVGWSVLASLGIVR